MALYYVWTACYHILQVFLVWAAWFFLKTFVVGVPDTFSFMGQLMTVYRFLTEHFILAGLCFLFLFGLELLLYWLDDYICKKLLDDMYGEDCL